MLKIEGHTDKEKHKLKIKFVSFFKIQTFRILGKIEVKVQISYFSFVTLSVVLLKK